TGRGDDRRIIAGTIATGRVRIGDEIVFYPSGKRSRVKSIEAFARQPQFAAEAPQATGFTLEEQVYVRRGEIAALAAEVRPRVTTKTRGSLFWWGRNPLVKKKESLLKLNTSRAAMRVEEIHRLIDASSLEVRDEHDRVPRHGVAECTLKLNRALAFDTA